MVTLTRAGFQNEERLRNRRDVAVHRAQDKSRSDLGTALPSVKSYATTTARMTLSAIADSGGPRECAHHPPWH